MANSQSVVDNKHNLSVSGQGKFKSVNEPEICIFCHPSSHVKNAKSPMWNRQTQGTTYTLYSSSTMHALPGQPDGSSILCLSCHDGTVALGKTLSKTNTISFASNATMVKGNSNLSTDLRNDHPISFYYDNALANSNGELKNPSNLTSQIKLEKNKLQCTSCHDPHKNTYSNFLVASTQYSKLCNTCHLVTYWAESSHNTSEKTWNKSNPNPWPFTPWPTVAQNACENCHNPHNSGSTTRLLKYQAEENNCLDCHNGNVATKNIQAEFAKTYKHNVYGYIDIHDPKESANLTTKHVECMDCHNSHAARHEAARAPSVRGANIGVVGVNQSGSVVNPSKYEYEICYKCHSDNSITGVTSSRKIVQNNLRLTFDPSNPSYHPVAAIGKNTAISGLVSPLTASSMIYCTDCHASSGEGASNGPHGSIYPQILKYNYDRSSDYINTREAYELCYQCHEQRNTISKHQAISKSHGTLTSCNTCHDPHGINSTQGNTSNNSYLINFNLKVVSNNSNGILNWMLYSKGHGACNLNCHGYNHLNSSY